MINVCLKDRLKDIIDNNTEYEKLLSDKICRFFDLEERVPFIMDPYIANNACDFKIKMMNAFNNYKKTKAIQILNNEFNSYSDVELVNVDRAFGDVVVGTYFCLKNITLTNKYSDEGLFKAYLKYLQKTTTVCFSYMKLRFILGMTEETEESELIDECYEANISLLSDMYNYLFDSLSIGEDIKIKFVEKLATDAEFLLYKICEKKDVDYLIGLINEGQSVERSSLSISSVANEYSSDIMSIILDSEKYMKSLLVDRFFKSFYNGKICEFEKNLLIDYNDFFEGITVSFGSKKANDVIEILRNTLFLRESLLMYEIALDKVNTSSMKYNRNYMCNGLESIDLEALGDKVNKCLSDGFSYLIHTAKKSPMDGVDEIGLEKVIGENGYLEQVFKGDIDFKIDSFKEFRRLVYGLWYDELPTISRDRSCINTEGKAVIHSFNLIDKTLNLDFSKAKNDKYIKIEIEKSFPNKIDLGIMDENLIKKIMEGVVSSDDNIETLSKEEIVSSKEISIEDIEAMKNKFIVNSRFFMDLEGYRYKYEDEESILKHFRRIHHLRLLYFKYKHACFLNESMCYVFEEQEPYLELMLNRIERLYVRLIYCIVDMYNENNPDNTLSLERLLELNCLKELIGTKGALTVNNVQYFKDMYDKHMKQFNISSYLEKNPADEFPLTRKMNRHFIIHSGPTNSGKTYQALEDLKSASTGIYLAPLRLLAIEVQEKLIKDKVKCSLITGEEELLVNNATHISSTVEKTNYLDEYDIAVIDECQMIGDVDRGGSWTKAILGVKANTIHLCTAPSAVDLLTKLIELCGDTYEVVSHTRNTELLIDNRPFKGFEDCEKGDALIVFSKKNVLAVASALLSRGIKSSVIYGALPYKTRKLQMEKFLNGETDIIVATDAIGLGINAPVRRIVFVDTYKYDGYTKRKLYPEEVRQIAGRAGRYGMYDVGYVNAIENLGDIEEKLKSSYWHIKKAKLTLPESIINIEGDLAENIKLWSEMDSLKNFEKSNVDRILAILEKLKNLGYSDIGNYYSYKLAVMYFEDGDKYTLDLWAKYLNDYFRELKDEMDKPVFENYPSDLQGLESYNKSLELYYAFSKSFSLPMDLNWVNEERLRVSEEINNILLVEIKKHRKTCKTCGAELKWDSLETKCVQCALMDAMQNSSSSIRFNVRKK